MIIRLDVRMALKKMSLNELSEKTGLDKYALSRLKNGRTRVINFSMLESLCEVLECTTNDLIEYRPGALNIL